MLIAGSEPDLMLITDILPKYHWCCINKTSLMISGYSLYLNFDPDSDITPTYTGYLWRENLYIQYFVSYHDILQ